MTLDELLKKYPNAFKYRSKNFAFDKFGFQCGDGWAKLLEPIAQYLEEKNKNLPNIYVAQIKEKFGGLRFYVHGADDNLTNLINHASNESLRVCEMCGEQGTPTKIRDWISTLCKRHAVDKEKKFL